MGVSSFIDMHMHVGPEPIPRRYTVESLASSESGRLKGCVVKSHFQPPKIGKREEAMLFGSVTLNNAVGGLNANAVYAAAEMSSKPIVVWFPTIHAANFLRKSRFELPPEWGANGTISPTKISGIKILDSRGRLVPRAQLVLKAIKDCQAVLATGHISWQESRVLVKQAKLLGIRSAIVTHPIYPLIAMPISVQRELAAYPGVFMEHSFAMISIDKIPVKSIAKEIRAVGAEHCIISSDVGQVESPSPSIALQMFCRMLGREGIGERELKVMGEINPGKILTRV